MARSFFVDTQIPTQVSEGQMPEQKWGKLLAAVGSRYEYRVSLNTFLELLNALGGGDEANFELNRKRLLVLTDVPGCEFFPLPGEFLRQLLGLPPERPDFSPTTLQEEWMPVIRAARSRSELTAGVGMRVYPSRIQLTRGIDLSLVRRQMREGQKLWVEELKLAKEGDKGMPPKRVYAEFHVHFFARAATTTENVSRVSDALDAAYSHLAWIHHEATKSTYKFERKHQDWMDNQQLIYLANPNCTFVTEDKKLISKLGKSPQRAQVRSLDEFISNP